MYQFNHDLVDDYETVLEDDNGCRSRLFRSVFVPSEDLLGYLVDNLDWHQPVFKICGRSIPSPRLISSYGTKKGTISYSSISVPTHCWRKTEHGKIIRAVSKDLTKITGIRYNSCLVNYYRDGNDSISMHSDKLELDVKRSIIVVNISDGPRYFSIKGSEISRKIQLQNGNIITMEGDFQKYYKHGIPKSSKGSDDNTRRISLTFRTIENHYS